VARAPLLILLLAGVAAAAPTGGVRGHVRAGKDARVIVYLTGFDEPPPDATPELRQKGRQFQPQLIAVTAGQSVSFPNGDPIFHNVFSLSPARRFDLGQFKQGETQVKQFPKAGVVEVYCNIHPDMAATILVLPNRRFAEVAPDGSFAIDGVPAGTWTIFAYDRLAAKPARAEVTVEAGRTATVDLALEETGAPAAHTNKYGSKYAGSP
jgi:plastocyanin